MVHSRVESPGRLQLPVRSMQEMLDSLAAREGNSPFHAGDGWRRVVDDGTGFRHTYDAEVAEGFWEFHRLAQGFTVAVSNIVPAQTIPRRHLLADQLVLSAMLDGCIEVCDPTEATGLFPDGQCTVYGLGAGTELRTVYPPGTALKWVSLFIDRRQFVEATGIECADLPAPVREFILRGVPLPRTQVPLSAAAVLATTQLQDCAYSGSFRRVFMLTKALELVCEVLSGLSQGTREEMRAELTFSAADYRKLNEAHRSIERLLDSPPNVTALAAQVGLTRRKLQMGFRLVFGDTVARLRDRLRLGRALEWVRDSDTSMIDIGIELGYEHASSFTRAFKSTYGISPIAMRRMARRGVRRRDLALTGVANPHACDDRSKEGYSG